MDFFQRIYIALALVLAAPSINADTSQAAYDYCREQAALGNSDCYIHPCPCRSGELELQTFDQLADGQSLCACGSQRESILNNRQSAVLACDEYQRSQRLPCFVSRGDCPDGFEALSTYDSGPGTRFTACRDQRHTRISSDATRAAETRALQQDEVLHHYQQLTTALEQKRQGEFAPLPATTIDQLENFFPGYALEQVRLVHTAALAKGCVTDCEKIYCAASEPVAPWTQSVSPLISRQLLHQVVHSERCEQQGGRERFAAHWFRHLPDRVLEQIMAGEAVDAQQIHFAMYMETHAEGKSDSICRRLPDCQRE